MRPRTNPCLAGLGVRSGSWGVTRDGNREGAGASSAPTVRQLQLAHDGGFATELGSWLVEFFPPRSCLRCSDSDLTERVRDTVLVGWP